MSHQCKPRSLPTRRLPLSFVDAALGALLLATGIQGSVARRTWELLLQACVQRCSLEHVVRHARGAPCSTAVREALDALLLRFTVAVWEARLNTALRHRWLPLLVGQRGVTLVGDEVALPYWGRRDGELATEVRGGSPKQGTAWFFTYVTVCALWRGQRIVLGLTRWRAHEPLAAALDRVAAPLLEAGLLPAVWLYDRGAGNVGAMAWWQAHGQRFVVAAARRGRQQGVAAILERHEAQGGWAARRPQPTGLWYTLHPEKKSGLAPLTVWLAVAWEPVKGRRRERRQRGLKRSRVKAGQRWRAVAWFTDGADWRARSGAVQAQYRRRQSIESSYRQSHTCRGRTSSKDPCLRLLLVGLSMLLQNEWAWFRRGQIRGPRGHQPARRAATFKDYCQEVLQEVLDRLKEPIARWWAGIGWLKRTDETLMLDGAGV